MSVDSFIDTVRREKATAILRSDDPQRAAEAMEAAVRGGFRVVEFTLTVPGVFELIGDFSSRDGLAVGAGTVLTVEEAERAVEAGADFLVSPVVDEDVIRAATRLGVASMPGTHTATEMLAAYRYGATCCKLFPAPAGGPAYVKSMLGPLPFLKIIPTNGVDHENAAAWLRAGAFGVGFVATLFEPQWLAAGDWRAVEERARLCLEAVQST